jgi:hypothetical protein
LDIILISSHKYYSLTGNKKPLLKRRGLYPYPHLPEINSAGIGTMAA